MRKNAKKTSKGKRETQAAVVFLINQFDNG